MPSVYKNGAIDGCILDLKMTPLIQIKICDLKKLALDN